MFSIVSLECLLFYIIYEHISISCSRYANDASRRHLQYCGREYWKFKEQVQEGILRVNLDVRVSRFVICQQVLHLRMLFPAAPRSCGQCLFLRITSKLFGLIRKKPADLVVVK